MSNEGIEEESPATLSERQDILSYVLKSLRYRATRLSRVMAPDMDTDDILSDVGVKVWKALIKAEYLKKPKGELIKIAYVTARRHIAGLIRTRMGPISRGEAVAFVPFHNDNVSNAASLLLGKDYDRMAEISKILVFESIQNEAIN